MELIKRRDGFCGSTLKIIALITMLIDHIGFVVVGRIVNLLSEGKQEAHGLAAVLDLKQWILFEKILRGIGRVSFPIFCFLLVEGFVHTRDWKKYAARLFAFALLSEIPFDLAFFGTWWRPSYQNVFFTLGIGVLVMAAFSWTRKQSSWSMRKGTVCRILILFGGMLTAQVLSTDYGALGVLSILVLYTTRENRTQQIAAGMISFLWEPLALAAFWPISHYNGERGISLKYLFYVFYPVHLLILGLWAVYGGL